MIQKPVTEYFTQENASNVIFTVAESITEGSLKVYLEDRLIEAVALTENIIRILESIGIGETIKVTYTTLTSEFNDGIDIIKSIRKLEERVSSLEKENKVLLQALEQRVPAKTFRQWLLVMEKNFGKSILDSSSLLGIQGESIPTDWSNRRN